MGKPGACIHTKDGLLHSDTKEGAHDPCSADKSQITTLVKEVGQKEDVL